MQRTQQLDMTTTVVGNEKADGINHRVNAMHGLKNGNLNHGTAEGNDIMHDNWLIVQSQENYELRQMSLVI